MSGDDETRTIYEEQADRWVERRSAGQLDKAKAFVEKRHGPSVDLGCGPGWYATALPSPVVALDFSFSMLGLAKTHAPNALRVLADLTALPFRRGQFNTAWANHSYLHVPTLDLPIALADLHRT